MTTYLYALYVGWDFNVRGVLVLYLVGVPVVVGGVDSLPLESVH